MFSKIDSPQLENIDQLELHIPSNEQYVRDLITKKNQDWDVSVLFCIIENEDTEYEQCVTEATKIATVMPILQMVLWGF